MQSTEKPTEEQEGVSEIVLRLRRERQESLKTQKGPITDEDIGRLQESRKYKPSESLRVKKA
jgi:hypothetical protein